jgi:predicted esterase
VSLLLAIFACSADPEPGGGDPTDPSPTEPAIQPRATTAPTGTCPAWTTPGTQDLVVDGVDRQIEAYWPANHDGPIGLMFAWHGLGDRANNFAGALDLDDFANDHDVIVVVPWSENPDLLTWNYIAGGGNDLILFDDVRNCAAQSFDLDLTRVWSMGFSFGALWTTFLTINASDVLAATVTFSGGVGDSVQLDYFSPVDPVSVLVAWGGENDQFSSPIFNVDFSATTAAFADDLEADDHTVVRCDHGLGHDVPPEYEDILTKFLMKHTFGVPSPFAGGDLTGLPDYCTTP